MTTKRIPPFPFLTLLALLFVVIPDSDDETSDDETVATPAENTKPPIHVALNGNTGNNEDE
jgi:hypothetical protein